MTTKQKPTAELLEEIQRITMVEFHKIAKSLIFYKDCWLLETVEDMYGYIFDAWKMEGGIVLVTTRRAKTLESMKHMIDHGQDFFNPVAEDHFLS